MSNYIGNLGSKRGSAKSGFNGQRAGGRRRSPTLLKLQWLAERVRKVERIRKALEEGTYQLDTRDVARAMLSMKITEDMN